MQNMFVHYVVMKGTKYSYKNYYRHFYRLNT